MPLSGRLGCCRAVAGAGGIRPVGHVFVVRVIVVAGGVQCYRDEFTTRRIRRAEIDGRTVPVKQPYDIRPERTACALAQGIVLSVGRERPLKRGRRDVYVLLATCAAAAALSRLPTPEPGSPLHSSHNVPPTQLRYQW